MRRLPFAALVAVVVCVHLPFLGGGWMTDDFMHIDYLQRQTLGGVFVSPDVFGYFRPIPQAMLLANLRVAGWWPAAFRFVNLGLHVAVLWAAFDLARLLLDEAGAWLATLAFALTPKAHTIAILWVSARAELLMSLFVLLAAICWIRWLRGSGLMWLIGTGGCYVLAVLSKEPAVLVPAALLLIPAVPPSPGGFGLNRTAARRFGGVAFVLLCAGVALALRVAAGARIPVADTYYTVAAPVRQDLANLWNYFTRALPSPAVVWIFAVLTSRRLWPSSSPQRSRLMRMAFFGLIWFVVLLLPVLPLPGRSELYLYLPTFGLSLIAGALSAATFRAHFISGRRWMAATALPVLVLGGYQASRAWSMHGAQTFSSKLQQTLVATDELRHYAGVLTLVPADAETERALRDSVSGYLDVALKVMFGRRDIGGTVIYPGEPEIPSGLSLLCRYDGENVTFMHR